MDAHANFAYAIVTEAPDPAVSGGELQASFGSSFPQAPFNATVWPANAIPLASNAEIVRITDMEGSSAMILRAQESTTARSIQVGDQIAATITKKTLTDAEAGAPRTFSAEIDIGPDVFLDYIDFDVGLGVTYVTCTLLAFDADGETIGGDPGDLAADIRAILTSDDPDTLNPTGDGATQTEVLGQADHWLDDLPYGNDAPGGWPPGTVLPVRTHRRVGVSWGFVRVVANITDGYSLDPYEGANNPTATWRVDITVV